VAIRQLSAFVPNEAGALAEITEIFYRNGIDLRAITVYDTSEYGIVRCIVDDADRAIVLLQAEGVVSKISEVAAIDPADEPGSLARVFKLFGDHKINIDYIYSFVVRKNDSQYFVFKVDNISKAEDLLRENGIKVIESLA